MDSWCATCSNTKTFPEVSRMEVFSPTSINRAEIKQRVVWNLGINISQGMTEFAHLRELCDKGSSALTYVWDGWMVILDQSVASILV